MHNLHLKTTAFALPAAWLALVVWGFVRLQAHTVAPGDGGRPAAVLPGPRSGDAGFRLILFAHPRCPCTAASLDELGQILKGASRPVDATVSFYRPALGPVAWDGTETERAARAIPGVRVVDDPDGLRARTLGARTSGQVLVYDGDGRLRFSGGITPARGHAGPSAGGDAVRALLGTGDARDARAPIYGCSLQAAKGTSHAR